MLFVNYKVQELILSAEKWIKDSLKIEVSLVRWKLYKLNLKSRLSQQGNCKCRKICHKKDLQHDHQPK